MPLSLHHASQSLTSAIEAGGADADTVIASLGGLALLLVVGFVYARLSRRRKRELNVELSPAMGEPGPGTPSPSLIFAMSPTTMKEPQPMRMPEEQEARTVGRLHSGVLRKKSFFNVVSPSAVSSVELWREDDKNVSFCFEMLQRQD